MRKWAMEPYALPFGAKGIEGDGFAVEFRGDKIVFVPQADGSNAHYTLHADPNSGVIDLHETRSDGKTHRTLFAVRKDDLLGLLQDTATVVPELLGLMRPLRLGWLKHRNIGIARGIEPVSDSDIAAVTRKRKRRLVVDPELYRQNINCPEFLEDVYDFPDGNFTLLYRGRPIGLGFKQTDAQGNARLFWIKRRDLLRFGHYWQRRMLEAMQRIAIPPDRYAEYPFLRV
jgi:hypothetical protein